MTTTTTAKLLSSAQLAAASRSAGKPAAKALPPTRKAVFPTKAEAIKAALGETFTAKEVADKLGFGTPVVPVIAFVRNQIHSVIHMAASSGISIQDIVAVTSAEIRPLIEENVRDGYATADEGLSAMLEAEGGCVSVPKACGLFRKPNPISRQGLTEQIRAGAVIAYRTGGGHYVVPVWQFQPEGGLIPGLTEVTREIKRRIPGAGQLSPFTFFLQADPVLGGRTPLEALRAGELENVLEAVRARAG